MMMSDSKTIFKEGCAMAFDEEHWQKINYSTGCFENNFVKGKENYRNLDLEKQRAYTLRNKSLLNLEKLLVDFETHFNENGGKVLWARNADDALSKANQRFQQKVRDYENRPPQDDCPST